MNKRTSNFLLKSGFHGLTAFMLVLALFAAIGPQTAFAASFTVTKTADTNDGVCDSDCSLREAIRAANAAAGADTITLPAGTFTLTLAGSDDNANLGDLDVTGPLTINGAGQGSTIIQAGTTNSNGIDKILSFNPLGVGAGFAVSMSNLTLRFGKNPETFVNGNGFGGCFDFDSGTSGAGSFTMSNVTVTDCSTVDADGGGGAIFLTSGSGAISITNSTFQNNIASRTAPNFAVGGGLFFGCVGGSGTTLTISNSTVSANTARMLNGNGGQGGGLFFFGACGGTPSINYQLHGVTISGNTAGNDGGGIYSTAPLTIDNSTGAATISGNISGRSGGGIWLNHTNRTSNVTKVTISGNSAVDGGGGIRLDSASSGNALNLSFSRIVNNTAGSGKGSGLSVNNGTANATNNWWGCSTGPSVGPCDTAKVDPASGGGSAGTGSVNFTPWLQVLTTASPSTILTNQTSSLSASVNTNSSNQDVSANNDLLKGLAVTWSAVGGNISGAQTTIQPGGTATATYTASAANASNKAVAKVDNDGTTSGSNVALITVNKAPTTTTINSDTPDPTVTGQSYTVTYSVTSSTGSTPTAPTGNVTVSDGTNSCTGTLAAGQCTLTATTAGSKTLTATYAGDGNFLTSASASVAHTVNKADTTTTITSDNPDPSVTGQAVTVQYSASVSAPGGGTPTGNVTVSDGTVSCTGTLAAGQCSLTFTSAGAKSLTATYAGDANYNGSTSAAQSHQVNKADTTTTITSDTPDPSDQNSAVTVNFTVTANAPGSGTPTGNVTVSDGVDSCTGTVSSGTCNITLTTAGAQTLTASYAGDGNFNGSTSAGEPHTVNNNSLATTTTITSDTPDPSVVGQAVTVQYSVTAASGTPTGNVTVSDGTTSCTASVSAGQCSLTFTSAGAKSLTATYAGDSTYNGSTSAAEAHQVNKADTATTITSDTPDPSNVNEAVTVNFTVASVAPGAGTPTGNVTVSDGVDSCTATVAAGQCSITLTTVGSRTLTATYAGDSNFNGSTSAGEPHTVIVPDTTSPDVIIDQAAGQADPTTNSPINFTVVFTEPVYGFGDVTTDVDLSASTAAGTLTASVTPVDSMTYTVSVSGMTASGTVIASIPANAATDAAGNPNTASTSTDNTVTFIASSPTTLLYNGGQIASIGTNFQAAAKLSSPSSACISGQTISFSLDVNPLDGTVGSYSLGSAVTNSSGQATLSVSTTGWQEGIYEITASFAGTTSCDPSSDSAVLTVAAPGNSATGGGWYTLSGSGRNNFGFNVRKVDNKCKTACAYKGNLLFMNNGKWKLKGGLDTYVKFSTGKGTASGVGDLYWWDSSLNGGLGDWALAQSGVSYIINFYDSGAKGKTSSDTFGINIQYTPVPPQPSNLPNSGPTLLKGGDIKVQ